MRHFLPLLALAACIGSSDPADSEGSLDSTPAEEFETCEPLESAFQAELGAIRSCTEDADCGQALTGTSCGCTRDLVARADADTTRFYGLISRGSELQCDLPLDSTCDCPEADGFTCDAGTCAWNYVR